MSDQASKDTIEHNIPKHVVITCDGNRRWAKSKGLPKILGHRKGVENIEILVDAAREAGIKYLTCWVLSTENREERGDEFEYMMELAREFSDKYKKKCLDEKIRYRHIGRKDRLPEDVVADLNEMEEKTANLDGFNFSLAIDYGGRDELVRTFKKIAEKGLEISEETISNNLDTAGMPDPDLLIRTGAHVRLSGIMPWAGVYSELYFTDTLFPDFGKEELTKALEYFSKVTRNFGK